MPEKWLARGLLVVIIALNVFTVYLTKLFNSWDARFFNSLQDKDQGRSSRPLEILGGFSPLSTSS